MNRFDTVIMSDLHLGARNARTADVLRFLAWVRADRIILAGDVFDRPRTRRLDAGSISVIHSLGDFARKHELIWLRGNHDPLDPGWPDWDAASHDDLLLDVGGKPYLVCHGHSWDKSLDLPKGVIASADAIYGLAQWVDPSHRLARWLKRSCKRFCRSVRMLQDAAVSKATLRGISGVILGHSHVADNAWVNGVHYLNTGCWTETPSAFVGIRKGDAHSYYWKSDAKSSQIQPVPSECISLSPSAGRDFTRIPEAA